MRNKNAGKMYKFINRGTRPESLREERRGKERQDKQKVRETRRAEAA